MRSIAPSSLVAIAAIGSLALPTNAHAQLLASEPASVSQTVDGTKITVTYHRPRARGRTGMFGTTVHWGEVWTPGANAATTLAVTKDVTVEGQTVPRGKYSVWLVVTRGAADWEMLLVSDTMLFHTQRPKPGAAGQIHLMVKREKRPFLETLTWSIPEVSSTGMTLAMQWDTVSVPLHIKVPPSFTTAVADDAGRRAAGKYHLVFEPMPGPPPDPAEEKPAMDVTFTIRQEGSELRALMDPPMFTTESGYKHWILIPRKGGWYHLGRIDQNEIVEIFDFFGVQFDAAGELAKSFDIRLPNDALLGKGTRLP